MESRKMSFKQVTFVFRLTAIYDDNVQVCEERPFSTEVTTSLSKLKMFNRVLGM